MKLHKFIQKVLILAGIGLISACADYLDVIPDNVATMEHAFSNRNMAERFLFTLYWYLPNTTQSYRNPGIIGGDEVWFNMNPYYSGDTDATRIARGVQNASDPYLNFWDGERDGKNLFVAIRDCNIFLENIHTPGDLPETERLQWIAEAKTLKAYFHFYLLQLYGPIPVVRENIPVDSEPDKVRVYRDPVDDVVDYIAELIDEALPDLLSSTEMSRTSDAGKITQPIAASIKAKALVLGASPLFNGNPDYADFKDKRGVQLISSDYDAGKWTRAAEAVKKAIDLSHDAGHQFYEFTPGRGYENMSPVTELKCLLRGAITDKFNSEIVWPSVATTDVLQKNAVANLGIYTNLGFGEIGPTLKIAEEFYTKNGLPIDEDPEWRNWIGESFTMRYLPWQASTAAGTGIDGITSLSNDHRYNIGSGEITAKLNFYREPRFYAWLGFDRGVWEMNEAVFNDPGQVIKARGYETQGLMDPSKNNPCGYFTKKLVNIWTQKNSGNTDFIFTRYTYPLIRLSDLYLLYAETLNETKAAPDDEVYQWIDVVRQRAGVPTVKESYAKALPNKMNKVNTKEGMRDIIKRERMIELSFESWRYFDLVRWKDAMTYMNQPVRGWNYPGATPDSYYVVTTYWDKRIFNTRDYLWPLKLRTIQVNSNLVQNPGW
jgi:hypothetical protein